MYAQMIKSTGQGVKISRRDLDPQERAFQERINAGGKIEPKKTGDAGRVFAKEPDRAKSPARRNSEIVGPVAKKGNWITRAPTLERKALLLAKGTRTSRARSWWPLKHWGSAAYQLDPRTCCRPR